MAKETAKLSRLEGAVLAELGRPEEETLALAKRMLELGRAVRERLEGAGSSEVTETDLASETPLLIREMNLRLPFAEVLTIYGVVSAGVVISYGASYYVHGKAVGGYYLSEELGAIQAEQLGMKQSEAAESLIYPTRLIEEEMIWAVLLNAVSTATAGTRK